MGLTTPDEAQALASDFGIALDATRGVISVLVEDCLGRPAKGVRVTTNVPGLLAIYGTSSSATATDTSGLVTFANVPVGNVDLTAFPLVLNEASSHASVTVRAGFTTEGVVYPTP